ncbi:MAG TPA: amidohydrolase family protein [bacterium]
MTTSTSDAQVKPAPNLQDRIIDIHAHIGSFAGYDLSNETLLANLQHFNIALALISNIDGAQLPETRNLDESAANQITLQTVRAHPGLLRGLAWARPIDEDGSPAKLEPFLRDNHFVGVKLHPEMNHFAADDSLVDGYLSLCAKYDVPAVFHSGDAGSNADPQKIYQAAKRHPTVPVILYHMGFKGPHELAIAVVKQAMQKRDADLYLETAQADSQAVLEAIKELGAERVLFGTDATYYGKDHYAHYLPLMELLRRKLSAEEFAKVMRLNAVRLFKLEVR